MWATVNLLLQLMRRAVGWPYIWAECKALTAQLHVKAVLLVLPCTWSQFPPQWFFYTRSSPVHSNDGSHLLCRFPMVALWSREQQCVLSNGLPCKHVKFRSLIYRVRNVPLSVAVWHKSRGTKCSPNSHSSQTAADMSEWSEEHWLHRKPLLLGEWIVLLFPCKQGWAGRNTQRSYIYFAW